MKDPSGVPGKDLAYMGGHRIRAVNGISSCLDEANDSIDVTCGMYISAEDCACAACPA